MPLNTRLTLVSITGADDRTDISELACLTQHYPFVEWALLYGPKEGSPRNPSSPWRTAFFDANLPCSKAVHLCGKSAFLELMAGTLPKEVLRADRVQLNINARRADFTPAEVLDVYRQALEHYPAVILQLHEATKPLIEEFVGGLSPEDAVRTHVLLDESRGTGVVPRSWTVPAEAGLAYCGFAGGLGPDNIHEVLNLLAPVGRAFWVDMESRVRTQNALDLAKVRQVLESANYHR